LWGGAGWAKGATQRRGRVEETPAARGVQGTGEGPLGPLCQWPTRSTRRGYSLDRETPNPKVQRWDPLEAVGSEGSQALETRGRPEGAPNPGLSLQHPQGRTSGILPPSLQRPTAFSRGAWTRSAAAGPLAALLAAPQPVSARSPETAHPPRGPVPRTCRFRKRTNERGTAIAGSVVPSPGPAAAPFRLAPPAGRASTAVR
jgi:hypothetical protein